MKNKIMVITTLTIISATTLFGATFNAATLGNTIDTTSTSGKEIPVGQTRSNLGHYVGEQGACDSKNYDIWYVKNTAVDGKKNQTSIMDSDVYSRVTKTTHNKSTSTVMDGVKSQFDFDYNEYN